MKTSQMFRVALSLLFVLEQISIPSAHATVTAEDFLNGNGMEQAVSALNSSDQKLQDDDDALMSAGEQFLQEGALTSNHGTQSSIVKGRAARFKYVINQDGTGTVWDTGDNNKQYAVVWDAATNSFSVTIDRGIAGLASEQWRFSFNLKLNSTDEYYLQTLRSDLIYHGGTKGPDRTVTGIRSYDEFGRLMMLDISVISANRQEHTTHQYTYDDVHILTGGLNRRPSQIDIHVETTVGTKLTIENARKFFSYNGKVTTVVTVRDVTAPNGHQTHYISYAIRDAASWTIVSGMVKTESSWMGDITSAMQGYPLIFAQTVVQTTASYTKGFAKILKRDEAVRNANGDFVAKKRTEWSLNVANKWVPKDYILDASGNILINRGQKVNGYRITYGQTRPGSNDPSYGLNFMKGNQKITVDFPAVTSVQLGNTMFNISIVDGVVILTPLP